MASQNFFITGTDTGVGKTWLSCLIIRHLRARGVDAVGYKPICCGDRDDAEALAEASEVADIGLINPVWLKTPLAPLAAAERENRNLDRRAVLDGFEKLRSAHACVIIEGAGGLEVPISKTETMADLAVEFGAPMLVVSANRLGALNHTLLTCRAIEQRGLKCAGVILNQTEEPKSDDLAAKSNRAVLESVLPGIPIFTSVFRTETLDENLASLLEL